MAKNKEITEEINDKIFRISAQQLFDDRKSRRVIPLTLSADIALSGGIPLGSTIIIGGKPKIGKTTIALQYASNAQKLYKSKVFFFPIEGRLDNKVLSQIKGLVLKDVIIILGDPIKDKDGKVLQHKKMPAEWWWTQIGDTIQNNPGCIIIVDSISALSDEKEISEELGYQSRGGAQKLESQFCRRFGDSIVSSGVTLFLLAQVIANTSGYGPPMQIKCGNAIKHLCDGLLYCKNAEKWVANSDGKILGHDIKISVEVSPMGSPYIECDLPLRFGEGIDIQGDLIKHCINFEVIKKGGAWFTIPFLQKDNKLEYINLENTKQDDEPIKLQGEENIRNWFMIHTTEYETLEKEIRSKLMV